MLPKSPTVTITQQVFDFMMIEVNHADILSTFSYAIIDHHQQAIRKGNFRGQMVQLRLSHIPEGKYQFSLHHNDVLISTIPFEKKSAAFEKSQLFGK
jgi:hypothetical protein